MIGWRVRGAACVAISTLALTACGTGAGGDSPSGELSGKIAGAGAVSQARVQKAWIAGFESRNPAVEISYGLVGSGSGQTRFIAGRVAYAGTDLAVSEERARGAIVRCQDDGGALIEVPVYVSPIAIVYNLSGVVNLKLSPEVLAKIFGQGITHWDDEAVAGDNPGVELPHLRIIPVNRGDVSGATQTFTEYLAEVAPTVWTHPVSDYWPVGGSEIASGDAGVVEAVAEEEGAIGYADAFQAGKVKVARIEVGRGSAKPTPEGAARAFAESLEDRELKFGEHVFPFVLNRKVEAPGAYPIVLVSYLLACTRYESAGEAAITKRYLEFVIGPGGRKLAAGGVDATSLPAALAKQIAMAVAMIEVR